MLSARSCALALASLIALSACSGDAQPQVSASQPALEKPHAAPGAGPHAGLGRPEPVPASFSGRIVLQGELAAKDGVLMVSACPKGSRLPLMSYVIQLAGAPPAAEGRRIVPFRLDSSNDLMGGGGLPHDSSGMELELSVRFDLDGKVETSEGDLTVAVPVEPDATDVEVALGG